MKLQNDPNDKYAEYEVDLHCIEPCELDDEDCKRRHSDKVLDEFCDTHPSAPQCKVYDD